MRKIVDLGYGQKQSVTISGSKMKQVTFKKNMANVVSIVVAHYVKNENSFGFSKVSEHESVLN